MNDRLERVDAALAKQLSRSMALNAALNNRIETLEADNSELREENATHATNVVRIEALEAALREFVEAYKYQDCPNYADELARAYGIADAALDKDAVVNGISDR